MFTKLKNRIKEKYENVVDWLDMFEFRFIYQVITHNSIEEIDSFYEFMGRLHADRYQANTPLCFLTCDKPNMYSKMVFETRPTLHITEMQIAVEFSSHPIEAYKFLQILINTANQKLSVDKGHLTFGISRRIDNPLGCW